jgi:hypothetical protein
MKTEIEDRPEPEALAQMVERGDEWYAYKNMDLGHSQLGHLKFLQVGVTRTFKAPPARMPDGPDGSIGWRYILLGPVDLKTGEIKRMGD